MPRSGHPLSTEPHWPAQGNGVDVLLTGVGTTAAVSRWPKRKPHSVADLTFLRRGLLAA